ncbi:MAG: HEPN domain-containing protein [Phormidesmis sp.]
MFDILPASVYQERVTLPPDILEAKEKARKLFKELPLSPERDSVLNALGRVGRPTLKHKVRHRARLITDVVGDRFPDLNLVIDQAIDCRNHFVHGSKAKIDYSTHSSQAIFFTDTLEFIFAASDLLESGWDIARWITRHSNAHPFSHYCFSYQHRLSELKAIIK